MRAELIIDGNGLRFSEPIRFNTSYVRVTIDLPDDTIAATESPSIFKEKPSVLDRINSLVGPWRDKSGPSGKNEYKALWHAHLEEKYCGN